MSRSGLLQYAHEWVARSLEAGAIAVDATVGNGHDTCFLAHCVGDQGRVYGFDIQSPALAQTQARLEHHGLASRCQLILADHSAWPAYLPESHRNRVQAVMFNLGYLPGSDKAVITQTQGTLAALEASLESLADHGVISIMAYPGHAGGLEETCQVVQWLENLDSRQFQTFREPEQPVLEKAPVWLGIVKK